MKRCCRFGSSPVITALGFTLLAGCQHGGGLTAPSPAAAVQVSEAAPKLSAVQVADVKIAYARSLEKRGAIEDAAVVYQEALRHDPNRYDALARLAVLHDQQAKCDEAIELHQRALAGQPDSPDLHCNLGYSLYLRGDWEGAEANLRKALALAPDHRRARTNLGLVLAHLGRKDEALTEFRKAGCDEAAANSNLAFVLTLERRWQEARQHYEQALTSNPSAAAVRKRLHELDALAARLEGPGQPATKSPAMAHSN